MEKIFGFVTAYLLIVNLYGFVLCGMDKRRAQRDEWRIPERRFFSLAAVGGGPGILAGMYRFRHKTKHRSFTLGIPALIFMDLVIAACVISGVDRWL